VKGAHDVANGLLLPASFLALTMLSACASFRDSPFTPMSGPLVGIDQLRGLESRRASKSEIREVLGEPASVSGAASAAKWTYESVRRRVGVEERGFKKKVTCQFVRDTHEISFAGDQVVSIATTSEVWVTTSEEDRQCTDS